LNVPPGLAWAADISWRFIVVVAALYLAVLALVRLRLVVVPLIVALFLATLLGPPASWLKRRGAPPVLAAAIVFVTALGAIAGLFSLLGPAIVSELDELGEAAEEGVAQVLAWLTDGPLGLTREEVDEHVRNAAQQLGENTQGITTGVVGVAITFFEIIAGFILALVVAFFFIKDSEKITGWIMARLSPEKRDLVGGAGERAWFTMGGYIRGTATIALVDAVFIGLGLLIIGVPLVLPLAVITFFGAFIPILGAVTAGALAALVALVTVGLREALLVVAVTTFVQQTESNLLEPIVMARAVKLHPVVILFALTAGAILGGILGAFLAVPIAAVISSVGNYLRTEHDLTIEPS
jgi:predicted PurR-regulated permease PerM